MSFRDFKNEIYLIIQLIEGHGFGFSTDPLVISANLAGNIHESFIVEPCPQPKFENEFVWVMDKQKMKSIWADKTPVRLECFSVRKSHRKSIGYIILNVKDAQMIQDDSKIIEKQIRLLGLSKDISLLKPELVLSFYITDVPVQSPQLVPQLSPRSEGNKARMADGTPKITLGSGQDKFILSVEVISLNNSNELLPSLSKVTLTYSLLGVDILSDGSSNHGLQLNILSSISALKTYFMQQPSVTVTLHMGSLLVGDTKMELKNLLLSRDVHSRKTKHWPKTMTCQCDIVPVHQLSDMNSESKPSISFTVTFTCDNSLVKRKSEATTGFLLSTVGAGGDAHNSQLSLPLQSPKTLPLVASGCRPLGSETYRTQPSVNPHVVAVTLTVSKIQLDEEFHTQCWLRLNHPSGDVLPPQHTVVLGEETSLSLSYRLTVLSSCPKQETATLQLGAEEQVIAIASLKLPQQLATTNMVPMEQSVTLECGGKQVGNVVISWTPVLADTPTSTAATLTDQSCSPPSQSQNATTSVRDDVLSPRARELKMLSFVEELEDWAEKQRAIIMEGLKEEGAMRMAALQSEWEAQVGGQVAEGSQLVESLHDMREQLCQRESLLRESELKLKVYKEELECIHRSKLQEFKDISRRMQDEFNHKLALIASDKAALEHEMERLKEDNECLKQKLREVETVADADKILINNLSREMKILKDKLAMEQESKKFFKEHCRKAEQEICRLDNLRQQELQARLLSEKKSLEQLAFQHIAVERNDLRQDQRLLIDIRQQLLTGQDSSGGTLYRDVEPYADERQIQRAT